MVPFPSLERYDQIVAVGPVMPRASSCTLRYFPTLTQLFPPPCQCSLQSKSAAWAGKSLLKDGLGRVSSPHVGTWLQPPFPLSAANTPVLAWPRGTGPAVMLAVLSPAVLQPWFLRWDSEGNRSLRAFTFDHQSFCLDVFLSLEVDPNWMPLQKGDVPQLGPISSAISFICRLYFTLQLSVVISTSIHIILLPVTISYVHKCIPETNATLQSLFRCLRCFSDWRVHSF